METWLATQTTCGPHEIDDEKRMIHLQFQKQVAHLLPINDPHKLNDVDLLYRFLIARNWDIALAEKMLTDHVAWRMENDIDGLLRETFPDDIMENYSGGFMGVDIHGNPLYFERPDPKGIAYLLGKYERKVLVRWHLLKMEIRRRRAKLMGKDRTTSVLDLSLVGVGILANTTVLGFLKEIAHIDQANFPECMRYLVIINAPWTFSTVWAVIQKFLDERVQKKINIFKGAEGIAKFAALDQVPKAFGGTAGEWCTMGKEIGDARHALSLADLRRSSHSEVVGGDDGCGGGDDDDFHSVCSNEEELQERMKDV